METTLKLPVGVEKFEEIRTEGFYYVDKTGLIGELLDDGGKVTLFTRPRRFGKSLNGRRSFFWSMSMTYLWIRHSSQVILMKWQL